MSVGSRSEGRGEVNIKGRREERVYRHELRRSGNGSKSPKGGSPVMMEVVV